MKYLVIREGTYLGSIDAVAIQDATEYLIERLVADEKIDVQLDVSEMHVGDGEARVDVIPGTTHHVTTYYIKAEKEF